MSEEAMKILCESTEKTKGTDWTNVLWFSTKLEDKMEEAGLLSAEAQQERENQRTVLKSLGYEIRALEELTVHKKRPSDGHLTDLDLDLMAEKATQQAVTSKEFRWDGIKYFSDMARLLYINEVGGHHFDVDMGLGEMNLKRAYYHNDSNGKIPLLGSLTAISDDPIVESYKSFAQSNKDLDEVEVKNAAKNMIEHARNICGMLNGMIASRPDNPHFEIAIEKLRKDARISNGILSSGMTVNKFLLSGSQDMDSDEYFNAKCLSVPVYVLDIEQITSEMDNR